VLIDGSEAHVSGFGDDIISGMSASFRACSSAIPT
jgi:hypothetical protein